MPNLACVIPTWRDGSLLVSAVRSVRPHVDVVICLDGGFLGDVGDEDRWSPTSDLLAAREAGAAVYPVQQRNASEALYERTFGLPDDYEPLPLTPLDPPLSSLESYWTKVAALLDLARRHIEHGWALVMHADELLLCGDGLRDELQPFYTRGQAALARWGDEDEELLVRLWNLDGGGGHDPALVPTAPGAPFLRHRHYLRAKVAA